MVSLEEKIISSLSGLDSSVISFLLRTSMSWDMFLSLKNWKVRVYVGSSISESEAMEHLPCHRMFRKLLSRWSAEIRQKTLTAWQLRGKRREGRETGKIGRGRLL